MAFIVSYALHLLILGICYAVHINASSLYESVHRKKQHTSEINTIPYKLETLLTFETLKWKYSFVTDVLIAISDESPLVYRAPGAPDVLEIVTSGHVISGQVRFGTAQLHYFKLLCTGSSHGKSVQAPIRL